MNTCNATVPSLFIGKDVGMCIKVFMSDDAENFTYSAGAWKSVFCSYMMPFYRNNNDLMNFYEDGDATELLESKPNGQLAHNRSNDLPKAFSQIVSELHFLVTLKSLMK